MNTNSLKSKKVLIPALAAVVLVGGGVATAAVMSEREPSGSERTEIVDAARAALDEDATLLEVDREDDGPVTFEVTFLTRDGVEHEVLLGADHEVLATRVDDDAERGAAGGSESPAPTGAESPDDDERVVGDVVIDDSDRAISDEEIERVSAAAIAAVPGTVTKVETHTPDNDDSAAEAKVAYTVDVTGEDGRRHEVELDADATVLRMSIDD